VVAQLDSVHGANYVANGSLAPHATGVAATFNPAHFYAEGMIAALDTRTAGQCRNGRLVAVDHIPGHGAAVCHCRYPVDVRAGAGGWRAATVVTPV